MAELIVALDVQTREEAVERVKTIGDAVENGSPKAAQHNYLTIFKLDLSILSFSNFLT